MLRDIRTHVTNLQIYFMRNQQTQNYQHNLFNQSAEKDNLITVHQRNEEKLKLPVRIMNIVDILINELLKDIEIF